MVMKFYEAKVHAADYPLYMLAGKQLLSVRKDIFG